MYTVSLDLHTLDANAFASAASSAILVYYNPYNYYYLTTKAIVQTL